MRIVTFLNKGAVFGLVSAASLMATMAQADDAEPTLPVVDEMVIEDVTQGPARPIAVLGAKLAYNSNLGAVAGASVTTDRLFGGKALLRFGIEASENSLSYDLAFSSRFSGGSPVFGLQVGASRSEANSIFPFDSETFNVQPELAWALTDNSKLTGYLSWSRGEISDVSPTTSILIRDNEGTRDRVAVGARYSFADGEPKGRRAGYRYSVNAEVGRSDQEHEYVMVQANASSRWDLDVADGLRITTRVSAGTIQSQSGETHVGDRYFLGQASLRGFAFGGFGPRDLEVEDEVALGGNSYVIARFDAQLPNAIGDTGNIVPGIFLDVGSLWGLDNIDGGLDGFDEVDAGFHLRASVGLSLEFNFGGGQLQINAAAPLSKQDYDRTEVLSLAFQTRF